MRRIYYNGYSLFLMLTQVNSHLKSTISSCRKILENEKIKKYLIDTKHKSMSIFGSISCTTHQIASKNQILNNKYSTLLCIIFYNGKHHANCIIFYLQKFDHK